MTSAGEAEDDLAFRIRQSEHGVAVEAKLQTDEKVLARVTDGIYRKPASAIRELISNAYDADATEVSIQTDRPRFASITVSDNGRGMSPETLAHVLEHIGGSAKRNQRGIELDVTSGDDPSRSPAGRALIGKIGIGLFSVAQLTRSFQIITKVVDDPWRTVAVVRLKTYSDETDLAEASDLDSRFEAGLVSIWRVPADPTATSGTTVVLSSLGDYARDTLRSTPWWRRVERDDAKPPRFHVGEWLDDAPGTAWEGDARGALPWSVDDSPLVAFSKLVRGIWAEVGHSTRNPSLEQLCDNYLQMVWEISLAAPLPYLERHPFDLTNEDADLYLLPGEQPGAAEQLEPQSTLGRVLGIHEPGGAPSDLPFVVRVDDLELRRPIIFTDLPETSHVLKRPSVFGGRLQESFDGVTAAISGGPLDFSAYVMWLPKVVPTEHNGALLRIHGASGTLFDRTFLDYKVADSGRLRQLICEVFIDRGFESALNIDREGFSFTHPHALRLTAWIHSAVARAVNEQKSRSNILRRRARANAAAGADAALRAAVEDIWDRVRLDDSEIPNVDWAGRDGATPGDGINLDRRRVFGDARRTNLQAARERRLAALAQVLAAYDLIDELDDVELLDLMRSVEKVLKAAEA